MVGEEKESEEDNRTIFKKKKKMAGLGLFWKKTRGEE